jgi:hypothetical protein
MFGCQKYACLLACFSPFLFIFFTPEYCGYEDVVSAMSLCPVHDSKSQFQQCQKHWIYCINSQGARLKRSITTHNKVSIYFYINSVQKLSDTPSNVHEKGELKDRGREDRIYQQS